MLQQNAQKRQTVCFKHFSRKNYAIFRSLKLEIRICALAVPMLTFAHTESLASRSDSLRIVRQQMPDIPLSATEVVGMRVPITFAETANYISVITREDIENAKVQTVNDLLKLCPGIDVRQRGSFGIQTDISIGGGTFDQTAILLNGININNPQTGHLTADFPVSISDIERIEIYDGASARIFGSQALNGAVNIITRIANKNTAEVRLQGGSYGTFGGGASANLASRHYLNRISGDYLRSDGATPNSAFDKYRTYYQGNYITPDLKLIWQGGFTSQRYGANTFYSAAYPDQWEAGSRWLASVKAITGGKIHLSPSFSWIRSFDHFQLVRHSSKGENFNRNDVFTTGLTAYADWALGRTAAGGELRAEGLLSSNMGRPLPESEYVKVERQDSIYYKCRDNRTNVSFFAEHHASFKNITLSAGIMGNRNTAINERFSFYPGIDFCYRPAPGWRLFGSWGKSLRLPTFTDLYYKSPTQEGNVGLRPERTSACKLGAELRQKGFSISLQGIARSGSDMIDWVMYHADDIYHSTQFKLKSHEITADVSLRFAELLNNGNPFVRSLKAGYTYITQKRHDRQAIYKSNYALEYLRHKLTASLNHRIAGPFNASWYFTWQKRMGSYLKNDNTRQSYHPYALINLKADYSRPSYCIYLSMENLTSHRYRDFGSVPQPGFTILAGTRINLNLQGSHTIKDGIDRYGK